MEDQIEMDSSENLEVTDAPEVEQASSVDDMSDEEFNAFMDNEESPADDNADKDEVITEVSLDDLYTTQMEDPEAKLDKPILVKFNGSVHKVDSIKELKNLAEKGISMTQKSQKLSEQTDLFAQLEANGYSQEDLRTLAENHKGEALTEVDANATQVDDIANTILGSNYADSFKDVVSKLPADVSKELSSNPQMLRGLAHDVESGFTANIIDETVRNMSIGGMGFKQAYMTAGKAYNDKQNSVNTKREALTSQPQTNARRSDSTNQDPWSMDDKAFDKYFDNL